MSENTKFDPILGRLRESDEQTVSPPSGFGGSSAQPGGGDFSIPQLDADPASPSAESAWVLHTTAAGGGGKLQFLFGMGLPVTNVGSTTHTYRLSYRTIEGTTKRVTIS